MKNLLPRNLILIGPISPPAGGEGVAFRILIDYLKKNKNYNLLIIDKVYKQGSKFRRLINPIRVFWITLKMLNNSKINGIYITSGQTFGGVIRDMFIILLSKLYKTPIVVHLHGGGIKSLYESKNFFIKKIMNIIYNKVDKIIVLGASLRDQFYFISDDTKIEKVPNTYDQNAPKIEDIGEFCFKLKSNNKLKLLYLSNVLPSKGLFEILEALLIIKKKNIPFEFHFGGSLISENGYSIEFIRNLINQYKRKFTDSEFLIHGYVSGRTKWDLILSSQIFLLPTTYNFEGQPISIIEAMYGGCCIIATKYRGIPDLISEGTNGFFVLPKSPKSISKRLIWLWNNPNILSQICVANHYEALNKYSKKNYINNLVSIFDRVFN